MAGIVAMVAGGLGGRKASAAGPEAVRRASSYKKMQEEQQAKSGGGKIKTGRIQTIQLNRSFTEPCDVYSWFEITVTDISVPTQTFDCSIEIHAFWQDYALPSVFPDYKEDDFKIDNDNLPIKMTEIFENQISCRVVVDPIFRYYDRTSTIYMMFVCEVTFVERMELQRFPLDRQFLSMEFNAYHGVSKTGNWNWILKKNLDWVPEPWRNREYCVRMVSSISSEYELLPPWINFTVGSDTDDDDNGSDKASPALNYDVASTSGTPPNEKEKDGKESGKENGALVISGKDEDEKDADIEPLIVLLRVDRRPHYYYGNIVFPNFLIGLGCGGAFIVPSTDLADRLGVLITLMLAAVAFRFVVSTMLPRVTYLTIMDKYLLLSFIMIVILIGENTIVAVQGLFPSIEWVEAFDWTFSVAFYIGWGIIHLFFVLTLIWPSFYRLSWNQMYLIDISDPDEPLKADDYRRVKTPKETPHCVNKWKKFQKMQNERKND